jgi:two-component system chemotaxis response regulator CheB
MAGQLERLCFMAKRDIIVIGASAGSFDVLRALAAGFPRGFSASIFIVVHIGAHSSILPQLLTRHGNLPATHAQDGEGIEPGHVYVAPPDRHMLVGPDGIRLTRGPREHFTRPAIDPLFRSAADAYGPRVIGVVLSGAGSDGASGLHTIKHQGGIAAVQDPATALMPDMPRSAIASGGVDYRVADSDLAALLVRLSAESVPRPPAPKSKTIGEAMPDFERPVTLTCPECGGALREEGSTNPPTLRCHTGHRFSTGELLPAQFAEMEHAVEVALRILNERAELCRRLEEEAAVAGRQHGADYWHRRKTEALDRARVLQDFLGRDWLTPGQEEEPAAE